MFSSSPLSRFSHHWLPRLLAGMLVMHALPPVAAQDAPPPQAKRAMKRAGPADIAPVSIGAVQYSVIHFGRAEGLDQNGGYIAAHNKKSGEKLWTLKVYETKIDPELERDVQDVFITSMKKQGKHLLIIDEKGNHYLVDVKARTVKAK
ncbi:MAG: hypothetical protein RL748_1094 [Pseudomonadota bacterium]|jgi:hypothetical protein